MSFENLQDKYGYVVAHSILLDLERFVRLNSTERAALDVEARLQEVVTLMEKKAA